MHSSCDISALLLLVFHKKNRADVIFLMKFSSTRDLGKVEIFQFQCEMKGGVESGVEDVEDGKAAEKGNGCFGRLGFVRIVGQSRKSEAGFHFCCEWDRAGSREGVDRIDRLRSLPPRRDQRWCHCELWKARTDP